MTVETMSRAVPATCVVERRYDASPARVFRAFADSQSFAAWYVPIESGEMGECVVDFRVGGRQMAFFGPMGAPRFRGDGRFEDIVPGTRIVTSFTMRDEAQGIRLSSTLLTVELVADGNATRLILTDQSVFYDWETPQDRKEGWGAILAKLADFLTRN